MLLEKLINDKLAETNIWFGEKQSTQTEKEAVHTGWIFNSGHFESALMSP